MTEAEKTGSTNPMRRAAGRRAGLLALLAAPALPGAAVLAMTAATPAPDGELIALCQRHAALFEAVNSGQATPGSDGDCPVWAAYFAACDAIGDAVPVTMAGVLAKARAVIREETLVNGETDPHGNGPAEAWASDIVRDLVRLSGGAA